MVAIANCRFDDDWLVLDEPNREFRILRRGSMDYLPWITLVVSGLLIMALMVAKPRKAKESSQTNDTREGQTRSASVVLPPKPKEIAKRRQDGSTVPTFRE